jgi:hypothetical protein
MLEIQSGSPVVGKVFCHLARSTRRSLSDVAIHGRVECIATNNVVNMSGRERAGLRSRVKTLKC